MQGEKSRDESRVLSPAAVGDLAEQLLKGAPAELAVLTDFDGTLAPIVADPNQSQPLPEGAAAIGQLSSLLGLVAVLSGRPASFLVDRLPRGPRMFGHYGLESAHDGQITIDTAAQPWLPVVERVAKELDSAAPAGLRIERKGAAVVLHTREAPEHAAWAAAWSAEQSRRTGLVHVTGRMVDELRVPVAVDKGTVAFDLLRSDTNLRRAVFIGDDLGDLAGFRAIRTWEAGAPTRSCTRIAVNSPEVPAILLAEADVVLGGPIDVSLLLTHLATACA